MSSRAVVSLVVSACLMSAGAHAFERVKLTDGELSCEQLYAEVDYMGRLAGDAESSRDTANTIASGTDMAHGSLGLAATAAAWSGAGSSVGNLAQLGGLASMFGGAAKTYSSHQSASAQIDLDDARARKSHLTELFIKRECKVSALDPEQLTIARGQFAAGEQAEAPKAEKKSGFGLW